MKYEIVKEMSLSFEGVKLYRIRALESFGNVTKGQLGGFIENEINLSQTGNCWIYDNGKVDNGAQILDNATIHGEAYVSGQVQIDGHARIRGNACILGFHHIEIDGYFQPNPKGIFISGNVDIGDDVIIHGADIKIGDHVNIKGSVLICGNEIKIFDNANLQDHVQIYGCRGGGSVLIHNLASIEEEVVIRNTQGNARVCIQGRARILGKTEVSNGARIYGRSKIQNGFIDFDILDPERLEDYIAASLEVYPFCNEYIFYKRVNKLEEGIYASCYDPDFIYKIGETAEVKEYCEDKEASCETGLHLSTPFYWDKGDTLIQCNVHKDDIITCMEGKLRVKKLKVLREIKTGL